MAHAYPPHLATFDYIGRYSYFLTFITETRRPAFERADVVELTTLQFVRAAGERLFAVDAYCFMSDHVHMLARGLSASSDCRVFIKAAKQYSGYYYAQRFKRRLWQRYGYERALRSDVERSMTIRYILLNPVIAGLTGRPADYPFLGSQSYTIDELIQQAGGRVLRPEGGGQEVPDLLRFFASQVDPPEGGSQAGQGGDPSA